MSKETRYPWGFSVTFFTGETPIRWNKCQEFFGSKKFSEKVGRKGYLVVTNQRLIFACKAGFFSSGFEVTYSLNLEELACISRGGFGFNRKLTILDKQNQIKEYIDPQIEQLVPIIEEERTRREKEVEAQKRKERIHIVLDFSSLKETLNKGGVIMTTLKCPTCSASQPFPEHGKVLICEHCQSPIKPVDIFEKMKSLIE